MKFNPRELMKTKITKSQAAFSIIELLVVMAIMGLLVFAAMGLGSMSSGNLVGSAGILSRVFDQARTYAMSNHTYVLVGITETTANTYAPNQALNAGTGCVVVEVVATQDATYTPPNTADPNNSMAAITFSNLVAVDQPYVLNNLHLVDLSGVITGNMAPQIQGVQNRIIVTGASNLSASANLNQATPSNWQTTLHESSFANGVFVNFDPQGSVHTVGAITTTSFNTTPSVPLMELGIQETHGSYATPTTSTKDLNYAALQIEGISGVNHLYQP